MTTAIVDLVMSPPPRSRRGPAIAVALLVHAALVALALGMRPSLEGWSADMAARIHDDLTRVEVIEIPPPPPPSEPPPAEPPPAAEAPPPSAPPATPRVRVKVSDPPAQAARVVTAAPGALDLTDDVVVQGHATHAPGGLTSPTGTGTAPGGAGQGPPIPTPPARAPAPSARDLSTPVSLPFDEWSCPWPDVALHLAIDEQTAVIRLTVAADGRIESGAIVTDPGDGFGAAALACARKARLIPARDREGQPVRATATARIRFYR